jgi:pimeloyl-ACP methyl ester carboxylesterase
MSAIVRSILMIPLLSAAFITRGETPAAAQRTGKAPALQTVTSRDGTRIAYDRAGNGPAVILVNGALADRSGNVELVRLLASRFTVYSYDRRGRGASTDTQPYSVQREIEDLESLVNSAGGSAYVYGKSSGAALALQAAAALGGKVTRLALYEAPYNDAEGAARDWRELRARVDGLLAADRRADAITSFMTFVGAPDDVLTKMKTSPAWPAMLLMAPTLAYDNAVLGEDRSVPIAIAARVKASALVMDGGASLGPMPFMRPTAEKLAKSIPHARHLILEGQAHDVSPEVLAPALLDFFGAASRPSG